MEVKKEVENPSHLGIDSEKNKSIPELIMTLRTAFRTEDFDKIEEILVGKEAEMKLEIDKMKEEISLFQKERDFHMLEKVKYETELKAANERADKAKESYEKLLKKVKGVEDYQTNIDELRKKNAELESAMNLAEGERDSHRIEKVKFETQFKDFNEREKKANERYEKLLEQVKKSVVDYTTIVDELKKKNSGLESEKKWAEEELNRWMSSYEQRVSKLEEEVKMMNGSNALERSGAMEVIEGNGDDDNGENGNGESVRVPSEEENVASNSNENARVEQNEVSTPSPPTEGCGKFAPGDPILIVDSDDDYTPENNKEKSQNLANIEDSSRMGMESRRLLKRKRASFIDLCESESNKFHEDNTIPSHCCEKGIPSVANDVEEQRTPLSQDQVVLRGSEEKIATEPAFSTILNKLSGGRINELVGIEESTSSSESDDTDSSSDAGADIKELLSKYQKTGENKRWASSSPHPHTENASSPL